MREREMVGREKEKIGEIKMRSCVILRSTHVQDFDDYLITYIILLYAVKVYLYCYASQGHS